MIQHKEGYLFDQPTPPIGWNPAIHGPFEPMQVNLAALYLKWLIPINQVLIVKDIKSKMRSGVKVYVVIAFVPSEADSQYLDPDMSGTRNFHRFPNQSGKIRAFYCGPDSRNACGQGNRTVCSCSHVSSVLLAACVRQQDPVIHDIYLDS